MVVIKSRQTLLPLSGYRSRNNPWTYAPRNWGTKESVTTEDNTLYKMMMWWKSNKPAAYNYAKQYMADHRVDYGNGVFTLTRSKRTPLTSANARWMWQDGGFPLPPAYPRETTGPHVIGASSQQLENECLRGIDWPTMDTLQTRLFGLGGTAISNTIPFQESASLATALTELLREGLPSLVYLNLIKGRGSIRSQGAEYLNYEFGIAPLIRDIQSLLLSVKKANALLTEYENRHGKHIRRRFDFDPVSETTFSTLPGTYTSYFPTQYRSGDPFGSLRMIRTQSVNTWFSGAYLYYLPTPDSGLWAQLREWESNANHILGSRITPELVWNVTSWSWLFDWFANLGDIISNISRLGQDGLALEYGYIMQYSRVQAEFSFQNLFTYGQKFSVAETFEVSRKVRRKASPFGFGLNPNSFTEKQWAILGALAMTKAPKTLW